MGYKHREIDLAPLAKAMAKPAFMIKIIPHVDCTPRICELVRYYLEDVTLKGAWSGPAALQLFDHAHVRRAPPAGARGRVRPRHYVADLTLGLGEVVFDYLEQSAQRRILPCLVSTGRVAIVTGAASGIGKEIALRFAAEGGIPVIADLNLDAAQATADEIKAKGGDAFAVAMNVTDEAQVEKGVADTIAKYGKIDILVSNAGIQIVKPLVDFPFADWKKLLSIHLDGAFLTTKACLKHMYAANYGRVIYMGSVHSKEASKLKAPYVTAKHGLIGLAKVLAKEGAEHNVTANVVCPGFVRTPLVEKQIPEQAKELGITEEQVIKNVMLKDTVDGEFTTTDDVADAVLFFAARQEQRADRPVAGRQPRLVHAVGRYSSPACDPSATPSPATLGDGPRVNVLPNNPRAFVSRRVQQIPIGLSPSLPTSTLAEKFKRRNEHEIGRPDPDHACRQPGAPGGAAVRSGAFPERRNPRRRSVRCAAIRGR